MQFFHHAKVNNSWREVLMNSGSVEAVQHLAGELLIMVIAQLENN